MSDLCDQRSTAQPLHHREASVNQDFDGQESGEGQHLGEGHTHCIHDQQVGVHRCVTWKTGLHRSKLKQSPEETEMSIQMCSGVWSGDSPG